MSRDSARVRLHGSTLYLGACSLEGRHAEFDVHFFRDLARDRTAMAITCGDLRGGAPLLARVHSSCLTSECLMGCDCDCAEQLDAALAMMASAGDGVLFYLMQEGRGAGLTAKARDRMIVQASENQKTTFEAYTEMGLPGDLRRYDIVAPMCRLLGIDRPFQLLTNNPDKAADVAKVLAQAEINICRREPLEGPTSAFNSDYLSAKSDSGHAFARPVRVVAARPPETVRIVAPIAFAHDPNRVLTASYFLPVALPTAAGHGEGVEWFRLSVIFDGAAASESVMLAHRSSPLRAATWMSHETLEDGVQITMSLLDRLPRDGSPGQAALVRALTKIRDRGTGSVMVSFDDRDRAER